MKHKTHPDIINRLKRAHGHLASVMVMLEEQRECLEVAQQLHAVIRALESAKSVFIHDHLEHCLDDVAVSSAQPTRAALQEFKDIVKYL